MGAWKTIVDYTVPSNTTSVVLNNFGTITKDDFIKVTITHVNPTGTSTGVRVMANSSVSSNYHRQFLVGTGTLVAAGRDNIARSFFTYGSRTSSVFGYIKLSENDRFNVFNNYNAENAANLDTTFNYSTSSGAAFSSGVTSLTFEADSVSNGIGAGTRIQIYRLAAEKVADITVTSNTTRVDITGLNIEKDSEYLLVSDTFKNALSNDWFLCVNDNTTLSNYYNQVIVGIGSGSGAARPNNPTFTSHFDATRALGYTHIKLSNIGAYTYQSYTLRDRDNIALINFFGSSTAENITSITKLNIIADTTNGIGSGSRLQLYKLY